MAVGGLRVLVLCADIGEGHVTVARALRASLAQRPEVDYVALCEDLSVMGPRFGAFMTAGFHTHLEEVGWTYDLAYRMFFDPALPRQAGQLALAALAHRGLAATVRAHRPDVVVTEYPVLSATLGQLRSMGRFPLPLISSISDPAGLYYWAHPGVDMHLLSWPESAAEVDRIAGAGRSVAIRPLVDARFLQAPARSEALAALVERDILPRAYAPDRDRLVVVSGGGWGIGDLHSAVEVALGVGAAVIALAGRSATTEARLREAHGTDPRVRVLGFTDQMPSILAAADALIHTTGGTTALEARLLGCPLINYGTGVAHVRAHAAALADQGLAGWARQRRDLGPALSAALAAGRRPRLDATTLPDAADVVIDVARASR